MTKTAIRKKRGRPALLPVRLRDEIDMCPLPAFKNSHMTTLDGISLARAKMRAASVQNQALLLIQWRGCRCISAIDHLDAVERWVRDPDRSSLDMALRPRHKCHCRSA